MALEVDEEFEDSPAEDADSPMPAHVGSDVDRIDALAAGVDLEDLGHLFGEPGAGAAGYGPAPVFARQRII